MVALVVEGKCPSCGAEVSRESWSTGQCPSCLVKLGIAAVARGDPGAGSDLPTLSSPPATPSDSPTAFYPESQTAKGETFAPGELLGDRYRIESLLGRGGMGEVWRAYDLKLRLEVALKSLHPQLFDTEEGLELLRDEVRAAREVTSPNVCRLYDLVEVGERELVSMEYIDGVTLLEHLQESGPLELKEANEIASQLLAGLEAIHAAGLVHRDMKPENVMLTRTGRVLVMDFGLTSPSGTGSLAGTPAYMAPEQARGQAVDARADVFSAGMVLAEMLSAEAGPEESSRQTFWRSVREEPPVVPESPWKGILQRALSPRAEERFASAQELARALEEVAFRVEGAEVEHPYPGLSAFRQEEAEFFFGREAEVEAVWKKLAQAHLLGLIGPSGSGKSSFINAGLLPASPEGWSCVRMTPGRAPHAALGRVLLPALEGDAAAMEALVALEDPASALTALRSWKARHRQALLIVDQFEELFTQTTEDVQQRFAELLGRAALDADIHVLLSMRDDFLLRCHDFEPLAPVFSELTPLKPPMGSALRRAVVQPALRCGYRFDEESVVEAMLEEVTRERGALPLIAFTAAQLWERRDQETGYLTREAYEQIGGVGGALAQHAETTLEQIGQDRIPIVRELFRNLVTAEGTRAARDRDELLSVFVGREGEPPSPQAPKPSSPGSSATAVLDTLIDARLLTSYELPAAEGEETTRHRIEIIHESLLTNWPRLVRWRMQDAEGAKLRDELRHQAQLWEQHGRSIDYLWTGAAYLDYIAWRERYPGGLTTTEEEFVRAMTAHAERRRRRRRMALAATFVVLLTVLAIVGGFWRRSVSEAQRAEAANLFSLAQLRLEDHPTAALAYATASLELADIPEARRLALEALWRGPTEFHLPTGSHYSVDFSPDGRWLATADPSGGGTLWPSDGGPPTALEGTDVAMGVVFSPRGDLVAATMDRKRRELGLWSFPAGRLLRSLALGDEGSTEFFKFSPDGKRLITSTEIRVKGDVELVIRSWPVEGGEPDLLARLALPPESAYVFPDVDPTGSRFAWADGRKVRIAPLVGKTLELASAISVEHDRAVAGQIFDQQGRQLATSEKAGTIRIWSLERDSPKLTHTLSGAKGTGAAALLFDPSGSMLTGGGGFLWDLAAPPDAEPMRLQRPGGFGFGLAFDRNSDWLATSLGQSVSLWPVARAYPRVLRGHEEPVSWLAFSPDGKNLVSTSQDGTVRVWPLDGSSGERSRVLYQVEGTFASPSRLAMAPDGSFVVAGATTGRVVVIPLDGSPVRELVGFTDLIFSLAVGPQARLVAAGAGAFNPEEAIVRVWDLATGETRILDAGDGIRIWGLIFTGDGDLWVASRPKLRRWRLDGDPPRMVAEIGLSVADGTEVFFDDLSPDGKLALLGEFGEAGRLWIQDLDTHESRELSSHAGRAGWAMLDPTGEMVISTDALGAVRIGPLTGEEPHLLPGHEGAIAVSPDGRWIASGSEDNTIRLWPMPDLSQLPLHSLPREELLAKLRSLTNLRVVEDPGSPSGWKLEVGPFPGWVEVPTW